MIKSGYLTGQIIDELSVLGEKAKLRNTLGYSDLSVYSEGFFCHIINLIEGYQLINTNNKRANEPGIDFGDEIKKAAFQITTTNTSEKVKHTLKKITSEQLTKFDKFFILIIGNKQKTYEAVDTALNDRVTSGISPLINFDPEVNIIDLTDLAKKIVGLEFEAIITLHKYIEDQMAKVIIDFQVADKDGNYETNGYTQWEALPTPKPATGREFAKWNSTNSSKSPPDEEAEEAKVAIDELINRLHRLPRITREFFAVLFERSEQTKFRFRDHRSIFLPTVEKTYPKAQSELDLLLAEKLIEIDGSEVGDDEHAPIQIGLRMGLGYSDLEMGFYDFIKANNLSLRKVIVELDFSKF